MQSHTIKRYAQIFFSVLLGFVLIMGAVSGLDTARAAPTKSPAHSSDFGPAGPPFTYAQVITANALVYADPSHEAPTRSFGAGYLWVSLAASAPITYAGQSWYQINAGEYVRSDYLRLYQPSTFQGVALAAHPAYPFGWLVYGTHVATSPGLAPATSTTYLRRYTPVTVYEEQQVDAWRWYRVGEAAWVEQRKLGLVIPISRPDGITATEKWIDVNLYEQTLAAYEGDRMVYATLVSSGLPRWPTQQGLFRVWGKLQAGRMTGGFGGADYYFLEDVPWTLYFTEGYALHGAYWHDRFGFRHSHGCVNMPLADAQWLFDWVTPATSAYNWSLPTTEDPGTWVWVRSGEPGQASPELQAIELTLQTTKQSIVPVAGN